MRSKEGYGITKNAWNFSLATTLILEFTKLLVAPTILSVQIPAEIRSYPAKTPDPFFAWPDHR